MEPLLEWFVSKGCSLDWVHPQRLTTPAHAIARVVAQSWVYTSVELNCTLPTCSEFVMTVLRRENRDVCRCHCSEGGCPIIGCVTKRNLWNPPFGTASFPHELRARQTQNMIRHLVYAIVDSHNDYQWMAPAIIRILTFDELNLTHTCCNETFVYPWPQRLRCKEIDEIQFVEMQDIKLLEDLMQEFKAEWEAHTGKFHEFMDDIWRPRMDKVCGEISDIDESQIKRIKQLGVKLDEVEKSSVSD
jgi:hypothetical protein